ncbi:hypothetical protein LIER_32835 [Lithospermum erythrorhizon]|uniref:Integrase catalytic domain-containing protein n=1 Tax=Lithospermum erythrorhizon TaxID=34254 RepID=A0AAV3RYU7_LITER
MNDRTEVFSLFTRFMAIVERQFDGRVKTVRSDNGTEFFCLKQYFADRGIIFQTSCVGTPQQNGRVERKHRHILNVARALKFQANLPTEFWGDCVLTSGYLINRTLSQVLRFKTPYEYLFGTPPTLTELRVFGSLCYVHNLQAKSDKFSSRSRKCVFLGYPFGKKGWKVFDVGIPVSDDDADLFASTPPISTYNRRPPLEPEPTPGQNPQIQPESRSGQNPLIPNESTTG